ncbi:MAG: phosphoribosylaminoimidazolesuccinocarboxamide synthase [Methanobrevibacter sp.]|jgi:phosphoribosylaminoimidazole-succinocarboxamide synthase|nr:phosphoribosylaminoimidazolesuccinocarboxamide synthase [Candidatus Methanovirga basalitermitum]
MNEIGELFFSGKAKDVYSHENKDYVIIKFRDDITAGDGEKKDNLKGKGECNSLISSKLFEILEENGLSTQYIELIEPGVILSKKLDMIPLEVILRNIATGSLIKKFPFREKQDINPPIIQMDFKNDEYHDPMLNDDIIIALEIAKKEELNQIRKITLKINAILSEFLKNVGVLLVDFKLEFGKDIMGNITLGDEISPDTCRFWNITTFETLDKDLFRKGEGDVMNVYREVCKLIVSEEDLKRWGIEPL